MADLDIRQLERLAAQGDLEARGQIIRKVLRTKPQSYEGLVVDVIASPEEDLPRLVLAQFLRDKGDSRGEFIEAQVEVFRRTTYYSRLKELRKTQQQLLRGGQKAWTKQLGLSGAKYKFHRGFVREVQASAASVLKNAETMFTLEPVTRLSLTGVKDTHLKKLAKADWLDKLESLKLSGDVDSALLGPLVATPGLAKLQNLNLTGCGLDGDSVAFLEQASFVGLRSLSLTQNPLGDEGAEVLAGLSSLAGLESLWLAGCEIGDAGVAALAKSPHLQGLQRLGLENNEASEKGYDALVKLSGLRYLEIGPWARMGSKAKKKLLKRCRVRGFSPY